MADLFAIYPSPLGNIKIAYTNDAVTEVSFVQESRGEKPSALSDIAAGQLAEYFSGRRTAFDLPLTPHGTAFQQRVWGALCGIPYGQTRSYKQIAKAVGNGKAFRAVGMANNKNPIAIVIPCHRVIGADGKLVGYAGGLDIKQSLLALETRFALALAHD